MDQILIRIIRCLFRYIGIDYLGNTRGTKEEEEEDAKY